MQTKTTNSNIVTYPVVETFHSIQGEGAWTGVNAFFIRLGGCDVHCPWCDQKETWSLTKHPQRSIDDLVAEVQSANPTIIVITGGEPLIHDLAPLTKALQRLNLRVHLETSGAHQISGKFDWITFSPKTFQSPHKSIYNRIDELKVVVADVQDLQWAEQQAAKIPVEALLYLQPEWHTPTAGQLVFDYVLQHSQWRVSLQTHKMIGVR